MCLVSNPRVSQESRGKKKKIEQKLIRINDVYFFDNNIHTNLPRRKTQNREKNNDKTNLFDSDTMGQKKYKQQHNGDYK